VIVARRSGEGWSAESRMNAGADAVEWELVLRGEKPGRVLLQAELAVPSVFAEGQWWDGYLMFDAGLPAMPRSLLLQRGGPNELFPMSAAMDAAGQSGVAVALAPDTILSSLDTVAARQGQGWGYGFRTRRVLTQGQEIRMKFRVFGFDAPCGWRDGVEKFWSFYPQFAAPRTGLPAGVAGRGCGYTFWRFSALGDEYLDLARRFRGGWEWCYRPTIQRGDWAMTEKYSLPTVAEGKEYLGPLQDIQDKLGKGRERYNNMVEMRKRQMALSKELGVCAAWYTLPCHAEVPVAKDFPDSHLVMRNGKGSTQYGMRILPAMTSFEDFYKKSLAEVVQRFGAPGIAYDSLFGNMGHYGPVKDTTWSAFDDDLRVCTLDGAAQGRIIEFARTLRTAGGAPVAQVGNTKLVGPYYLQALVDAGLVEYSPTYLDAMRRKDRMERLRVSMGRKSLTFWLFDFSVKRTNAELGRLVEKRRKGEITAAQLKDYLLKTTDRAIVWSYYHGAFLSPIVISGNERIQKALPALDEFLSRGWRESPRAKAANKDLLVSRTGQGAGSMWSVGNLADAPAKSDVTLLPEAGSALVPVAASVKGGVVQTVDNGRCAVAGVEVGARSTTVMAAALLVEGSGKFATSLVYEPDRRYELAVDIETPGCRLAQAWLPQGFAGAEVTLNGKRLPAKRDGETLELDAAPPPGKSRLTLKAAPRVVMDADTRALAALPVGKLALYCAPGAEAQARGLQRFFAFWRRVALKQTEAPFITITTWPAPAQGAVVALASSAVKPVKADDLLAGAEARVVMKDGTLLVAAKDTAALANAMRLLLQELDLAFPFPGHFSGEHGPNFLDDASDANKPLPEILEVLDNGVLRG
ncbi:MAG TPA: hypothetical protein P5137_02800, partial [Candidatus Brocadiia bacterium]|nr:hypothetical protein [Candidatus Brocadiia bacterium]